MPWSFRRARLPVTSQTAWARASQAEHVFVAISGDDGVTGLGEGFPVRTAAETPDTVTAFLDQHADALCRLDTIDGLKLWAASHVSEIDKAPGAFCAAELALLDLLARRQSVSVETLLGIKPPLVSPRTSAIYGPGHYLTFQRQALFLRASGLRSSRLVLTGNSSHDVRRARRLGPSNFVRLDAHNRWPDAQQAITGLMPFRDHVWAVEEPVKPRDWAAMEKVREVTGLSIIASESLLTAIDLEAMPSGRDFIPSLRISKQGGLLRSLDLLGRAREQGRAIIVGAEPGESSILARAGLALTIAANGGLLASEVASRPRMRRDDTTTPSLRSGRNGVIDLAPLEGRPGWGLAPTQAFSAALGPTRTPSAG